ncbi:hypothetical protein VTJ49DRAFT_2319 [Mycothermus thermophilus]|uniref:Diphthamide biosynthesis protein 4 n=1 Tax=Humicola insolens TaxID=85995 RepID=A0ABR3VRB2_HUMIN
MRIHHCQCTNTPTYYEILSLSPSSLSIDADPSTTARLIKRAYRRALLNHHPDKQNPTNNNNNNNNNPTSSSSYTIDQISAAYATLSRPDLRQAYDRALLQQQQQQQLGLSSCCGTRSCSNNGLSTTDFQTGIEIIDLDDLECSTTTTTDADGEEETKWFRSCRCGNPRGYEFGEADLEEAADVGELMVGCVDCSLWLRVQFAVIEEEVEEDEAKNGFGGGAR